MTGRMNEEVTTTRSDVIVALQDHGYTGRVNVKKTQLEEWLAEIDALPTIKERQTKAEQLSQENPKRDAGQPRGRGDGGMTWNECIVELRRVDREALQLTEQIREPEPHEPDVVLLAERQRLLRRGCPLGHEAETYPPSHIRGPPVVVSTGRNGKRPVHLRGVSNRLKVK